ncbi:MAG: hypothetical protein Q9170_001816 [Blastenia crenularia]
MARPFDDHLIFTGGTNLYSTSAAANRAWNISSQGTSYPAFIKYDDAGQSFTTTGPSATSSKSQRGLRLTKIKSSPSQGALAAAQSASRQRKGHRRGRSASETTTPTEMSFTSHSHYASVDPLRNVNAPPAVHSNLYPMAPPKTYIKTKAKIKPLLRKMSSYDQNTIDLSKSAAENEGLGIFTSSAVGGSGKTSSDAPYSQGGYHNRNISGNSHISTTTTSSHHLYGGTQYVHPMRQTPRAYTPPLSSSFANSLESGSSAGGRPAVQNDHVHQDHSSQQNINPTSYTSFPSPRRIPPPLHVRTGSASRLASSSQTNLPGTPSSLRQQAENPETPVIMPSTRTSFDSMFRKRSRANTVEDPVVRAAQVAVLRKEFDERERAKDETRREQETRKAQKEAKRQQKRDESQQRKSESQARKRAQSNATSEKSAIRAFQTQQNSISRPKTGGETRGSRPQTRGSTKTAGKAGKAITNKWQLFVFWLKTMLLKWKRKLSGGSS